MNIFPPKSRPILILLDISLYRNENSIFNNSFSTSTRNLEFGVKANFDVLISDFLFSEKNVV